MEPSKNQIAESFFTEQYKMARPVRRAFKSHQMPLLVSVWIIDVLMSMLILEDKYHLNFYKIFLRVV